MLFTSTYFDSKTYVSRNLHYDCFGNETELTSCHISSSLSCSTNNLAGVYCRGKIGNILLYTVIIKSDKNLIRNVNFSACIIIIIINYAKSNVPVSVKCLDGASRLIGGQNKFEGRVEVCSNGLWGTVYGGYRYWDYNDAAVVCRQLIGNQGHASTKLFSVTIKNYSDTILSLFL